MSSTYSDRPDTTVGQASLTVSDILRSWRRRWWVLLICPLLAAGIVYLINSSMQPVYEARLTLVVEGGEVAGDSTYNDILAAERLARTYSQLVTARNILDETIARLNLPTTSSDLDGQVAVAPITDTQLLSLTVRDESPSRAASTANMIAEVFIEANREQRIALTGSSQDEIQSSVDDVRQRIENTTARIAELENGADAQAPSTQTELTNLRLTLSQDQATYSSLLDVQQRMALAEAQAATQVRIADQAVPPTTTVSPRTMLNTGIAAVLGFAFAAFLLGFFGYLDNTVKSRDDIQRVTGSAVLGAIPRLEISHGLQTLDAPNMIGTEAYRGLRTNLQFALAGKPARSIVLTSVHAMDGKTTTAINLAAAIAQGGHKVILVDADLRRARIHKRIPGVSNRVGLTTTLLHGEQVDPLPALQRTSIPGLRVLATGPLPPNPPDVLGSPRMLELIARLEQEADVVIIDVPPLAVSDPLIVAGLADAIILVARSRRTRSPELARAIQELKRSGTPLLGVVLNDIQGPDELYSSYYANYRADDIDKSEQRTGRRLALFGGKRSREAPPEATPVLSEVPQRAHASSVNADRNSMSVDHDVVGTIRHPQGNSS